MRQEPLKKQWRVLIPSQSIDTSACKQAFEWGYNAIALPKAESVSPLKPLIKVIAPHLSPFGDEFREFLETLPRGASFLWESALFKGDFKDELLKRAMLPSELHVQEIEVIEKYQQGQPLFYLLPHPFLDRHLDFLLKRTPASVHFIHSAVSGDPDRLDLSPHPFLQREDARLIPLYHADPLGSLPIEGRCEASTKDSYAIAFDGPFVSVATRLKEIKGIDLQDGSPFDTRLCYLKAISAGKENPPLEEFRLLADLLIAEMRYEAKKGIKKDQETKKRLLVQSLEKMRLPIPLTLSME